MARPASTSKRDNEKKKQSKRLEKQRRKEDRKTNNNKGATLEDMFAYVDENGMITSTPQEAKVEDENEDMGLDHIMISTPKKTATEEDARRKGRVEFFNDSKGYGFIKDLDSVKKYFFHISAAPKDIKEGNFVSFELERGTRDYNAVNIQYNEGESS
ncbi:cold shock CspA family protein [Parabacteroides sp. PF5-5]|uniref:cold-shock protein n=1 Tax=unclassified Parabacteroides TaxID=2649774 RepID=UPI002474134D|nr:MULTISPECIES: cold shock domain-containing protein [unclassified Parabacteroides]MDH6303917.1 cold shock CspA family protein [Parabacteroides sp. PH5-39]MDH6314534.1 cold shock CspA family protein [Parabacteroides sp. PF5-13]MDH6318401.1 cold shock CspA family protein [Parabacteroides sp. PH5-13]MDH6322306.1 cold shock CspA family protein [Parabacteroides sp. PH5-8]MDH6325614.1 cold shock CspA family protein [Parabacteroides sp. PH5-41]